MKKLMFTLAIFFCTVGIVFTGCVSPSKKVENAEDKLIDSKNAVLDAKIEQNQAHQDSITEYQQFKIKSENRIIANEKSIEELRVKILDANVENKALYETKLAELQKKNYELKIKLADFEEEGTDKWQSFKNEFLHDMDELGKSFSDFTINNTK